VPAGGRWGTALESRERAHIDGIQIAVISQCAGAPWACENGDSRFGQGGAQRPQSRRQKQHITQMVRAYQQD
jgi:hypothetical protein